MTAFDTNILLYCCDHRDLPLKPPPMISWLLPLWAVAEPRHTAGMLALASSVRRVYVASRLSLRHGEERAFVI